MQGLLVVFRKELSDAFTGKRFLILFPLIFLAGILSAWSAAGSIGPILTNNGASISGTIPFVFLKLFTASNGVLPSFKTFIIILLPIMGIALGFDSVNREKGSGTMSRLLAQPIYRDAVINGKFLAGVVTIAIMMASIVLIVSGIGVRQIGVVPSSEEAARIFAFLIVSIIYGAFWLGLAMLFSILLERPATSAMASIAVWIFFAFFMQMIATGIANFMVPVPEGTSNYTLLIKNIDTELTLNRLSPIGLFNEAGLFLLEPFARSLRVIPPAVANWMVENPISMAQSMLVIWPHLVGIVALTAICFAGSYVKFMREEIRST
ncbi:MAG: ABC transporter permease [Chloroflexi bacterium]|nr:ABC transporter permease [Chloroflexota bacterium]